MLVPVDDDVLARMVAAATSDAAADEVTPRLPGDDAAWSPARVAWLQALHRECRSGLDGPRGQATWAVLRDDAVVGAVRLARTEEQGVLETGIWLTRAVRGTGLGRAAVGDVVQRARTAGALVVRADTTPGNTGALAVLTALGFACSPSAGGVRAVLRL
ncbi:MAG: GCN5-related N-acetyltransferase [Frankiales bacterium]|nr:GCN5-related N-acetyltransferase [Frankiales bacterium]